MPGSRLRWCEQSEDIAGFFFSSPQSGFWPPISSNGENPGCVFGIDGATVASGKSSSKASIMASIPFWFGY